MTWWNRTRKKNLATQNKKLTKRITDTRQRLHLLSEKIQGLKNKSEEIAQNTASLAPQPSKKITPLTADNIDAIVTKVSTLESFFTAFAAKIGANPSALDELPLAQPVGDSSLVIARFGPMKDPFSGTQKKHQGIDFAANPGTPVYAPAAGVVVSVENHPRWGRKVTIRHSFGLSTAYAHLGTVTVSNGKAVKRGDVIATVGMSGITTGPHLHYEVWRNGRAVNPQDYFFPAVASTEQ